MTDPNLEAAKAEVKSLLDAALASAVATIKQDVYDQVIAALSNELGETVVYKQKGDDGNEFGTTVSQALFWTDYRTKIIEGKLDNLTRTVDGLSAT